MFVVNDGLHTSRTMFPWFIMILRLASSRAERECAAITPSDATAGSEPASSMRSACQARIPLLTSCSAATIAAAEPGDMSGSRPGICSAVDWMRPSRYSAAWTHACAWLGIAGSSFSSISCEPPRSRRATSRKN